MCADLACGGGGTGDGDVGWVTREGKGLCGLSPARYTLTPSFSNLATAVGRAGADGGVGTAAAGWPGWSGEAAGHFAHGHGRMCVVGVVGWVCVLLLCELRVSLCAIVAALATLSLCEGVWRKWKRE